MSYKNFLAYLLTVMVGLSLTACPDDECATDAGVEAGAEGGAAGGDECLEGGVEGGVEGGAEAVVYSVIVIQDNTDDINNDGTPGVDLCEIDIECADGAVTEAAGSLQSGSPECDGSNNDDCICREEVAGICGGTDRGDDSLIFDGIYCDEDGDNYASVGIGGEYTLDTGVDLMGCDVTVHEKKGSNAESYLVYACPADYTTLVDDCVEIGYSEAASGEGVDSQSFPVSWEE